MILKHAYLSFFISDSFYPFVLQVSLMTPPYCMTFSGGWTYVSQRFSTLYVFLLNGEYHAALMSLCTRLYYACIRCLWLTWIVWLVIKVVRLTTKFFMSIKFIQWVRNYVSKQVVLFSKTGLGIENCDCNSMEVYLVPQNEIVIFFHLTIHIHWPGPGEWLINQAGFVNLICDIWITDKQSSEGI